MLNLAGRKIEEKRFQLAVRIGGDSVDDVLTELGFILQSLQHNNGRASKSEGVKISFEFTLTDTQANTKE